MSEKIKILFCGDVEGRFDTLFKRVETINTKSGPFDLLFCVGNFFGINNSEFNKYRIGDKKVPIQTYVLGPNKEEHVDLYPKDESDYELCQNVFYLGKRGLYHDNKGLKIAYLSGVYNTNSVGTWAYNEKDVSDLCDLCLKGNPSFRGVDILLTAQWPSGIIENEKVSLTVNMTTDIAGYACMKLKPRYFVSGLEGIHYERAPFRCPDLGDNDTTLETVTRFIGLARVGNPKKDKWIYALSVTPLEKMKISELMQKTTDETPCPFNFYDLENKILKTKRKHSGPNQYFYDMNASPDDLNKNKKKPKRPKIEFDQSKCWFCLASPSVEKHLVITVGNHCYLALAKGGIVEEHFLICPIEHYQSTISLSNEIVDEIKQFKEALQSFYDRDGRVGVFFERNYKTSHMQLQAIPIPKNATKELKEIFMDEADCQGFKLQTLEAHSRLDQVFPPKTPYFTVELPDETILYTKIEGSQGFPLNFAREVLASGPILNLSDKTEWKDCILQKDEEVRLVERIRTDFEPFDFTS